MAVDTVEIRKRLEELRRRDPAFKVFGANGHRYRLNPALTDAQVSAIEKKYRITLPADYRRFLIEVGNGGAGPYYGVFKLEEEDDGHGFCSWSKGTLLGDPSELFTHREAWNLPESFFAEAEEASDETWEESYWAPRIMNGAIPICHVGCALREWLVVTGPEAGNVWRDDRADQGGIRPLALPGRPRLSFTDWYLDWLKSSLKEVSTP